jgi:hypothetical protein
MDVFPDDMKMLLFRRTSYTTRSHELNKNAKPPFETDPSLNGLAQGVRFQDRRVNNEGGDTIGLLGNARAPDFSSQATNCAEKITFGRDEALNTSPLIEEKATPDNRRYLWKRNCFAQEPDLLDVTL